MSRLDIPRAVPSGSDRSASEVEESYVEDDDDNDNDKSFTQGSKASKLDPLNTTNATDASLGSIFEKLNLGGAAGGSASAGSALPTSSVGAAGRRLVGELELELEPVRRFRVLLEKWP